MSLWAPDRAILQRQVREKKAEERLAANQTTQKLLSYARWENKTAATIVENKVRNKVHEIINIEREKAITERRQKLSQLFYEEKQVYEKELYAKTRPDPSEAKKKMAERAYELKEKREKERDVGFV